MAGVALVQTLAPNRHHHPHEVTMTQPRWTIDDEGLVRWRDLHAVAALNENNDDCFEAYDALVAAVRDADTLHQASAVYKELLDAAKEQCRLGPVRTTSRLHAATRLSSPLGVSPAHTPTGIGPRSKK